jgi:hypothetical protein
VQEGKFGRRESRREVWGEDKQGSCVADPNLNPDLDLTDPYVFGPPGSASLSKMYGSSSGSFYYQAKIVKKPRFLLYCVLLIFYL